MKYYRINKQDCTREEISRERAYFILTGSYKDNEETRKLLDTPQRIPCMFSIIEIVDEM